MDDLKAVIANQLMQRQVENWRQTPKAADPLADYPKSWPEYVEQFSHNISSKRPEDWAMGFLGPIKNPGGAVDFTYSPTLNKVLNKTGYHFDVWGPGKSGALLQGSSYRPLAQVQADVADRAFGAIQNDNKMLKADQRWNPQWEPDFNAVAQMQRATKPPEMTSIGGKYYTKTIIDSLPQEERRRLLIQMIQERSKGLE